jgi:Zn-dependent membrane protease YugP
MFFFDSTIFILIPAIILTLYAQYKVKTTYLKYSKILAKNGLSGKETAEELLLRNNLINIKIEPIEGRLSDHYDHREKKLGLSEEIYYGKSLAAQGIVAHEIGHALQDAKNYFPLSLRSNLVPITNIGSHMAVPLFLIGFIFSFPNLLVGANIVLDTEEINSVKKVLNAAALTYVAAASVAVFQLLRLIVLRNRR